MRNVKPGSKGRAKMMLIAMSFIRTIGSVKKTRNPDSFSPAVACLLNGDETQMSTSVYRSTNQEPYRSLNGTEKQRLSPDAIPTWFVTAIAIGLGGRNASGVALARPPR